MKIFDLTRPLFGQVPVYPGDPVPSSILEDHGEYRLSRISLGTHSGTHIDAPAHFLKDGLTVDAIPLGSLIGRCRVLDLRGAGTTIVREHLDGKIDGVERVLLKTSFSGMTSFREDYPSVDISGAAAIGQAGLRCIGTDAPSIESFGGDGSVHRRILGRGCCIIELLDLSGVEAGDYQMIALPLRLAGLDGSPARVVLMEDGS